MDPRLIELARAVERDLNDGRGDGALTPVRYLIAEYVYLERAPRHIFEFIRRADIKITYKGMHAWLMRNFGRGKDAVRKAGAILQEAADSGAYSSPYIPARRGVDAKNAQQAKQPIAQALERVDAVAVQQQGPAGALALDAVQKPAESATDSIAFSRERNFSASPARSSPEPAHSSEVAPAKPSLLAVPGQAQKVEAPHSEISPARNLQSVGDEDPASGATEKTIKEVTPAEQGTDAGEQTAEALKQERLQILREGMKGFDLPFQRIHDRHRKQRNSE